jgi:hypothetical protein
MELNSNSFQMDISCRNTKQSVGVLFTNTNHITLKYVTDNWGTDSNGFKLVITAIKDPSVLELTFKLMSNFHINFH